MDFKELLAAFAAKYRVACRRSGIARQPDGELAQGALKPPPCRIRAFHGHGIGGLLPRYAGKRILPCVT